MEQRKNKGFTIIIVLVAICFIAILATVALTISAANLQRKTIQTKSQETFYNAESALDELKANMETELATIIEQVYTSTMLTYSDIPVGERNVLFKQQFLETYLNTYATKDSLSDSITLESGTTTYDWSHLQELLTKTKEDTSMENTENNTLEWKFDAKDNSEQYIYFRNVTIDYIDETNYESKITTDLKITVPDVNMESIGNLPTFTEYSLIANDTLLVSSAKATIAGNVYAGDGGILSTGSAANLSILADQVITRASITANDGATITMDDSNKDSVYDLDVWAKNIETTSMSSTTGLSETLDLAGNFYIADDTTLNANHSTVTYHGNYYGYSYGETAAQSSAMIANYSDCVLDLSDVVNLFVAGRAYIEAPDSEENSDTSSGILTGEAISTKASQAVYRLPEECIATGENPIPLEEYESLVDGGKTNLVDTSCILAFSQKALSEYVDEDDPYETIFDQTGSETYVYLYPKFKDVYAANQYMADLYDSSDTTYLELLKQRMSEFHTTIYPPTTFDSESGRKTFAGNVLVYDAEETNLDFYENTVDAVLPQQFAKESDELLTMYQAYYTKLMPSLSQYTTEETDAYDQLFDQLIVTESGDESHPGLKELLGANRTKEQTDETYGSYLLSDNETTSPLVIDSSIGNDVHLIIATGDVTVERDFTGLIIAKGTVELKNGVTVTKDSESIFDLICNTEVKTVFRDYNTFDNYLMTTDEEQLSIADLIETENWKKE